VPRGADKPVIIALRVDQFQLWEHLGNVRGTEISERRARGGRRALATAALATAIALALGAPARAGLYWSAPSVIGQAALVGLSCPTESLCVGVDQAGDVVASTDPTGGTGAWSSAQIAGGSYQLSDVACTPDGGLCVAVGGAGIFTSSSPTAGASAWQHVAGSTPAATVSCPSEQLCVAARSNVLLSSTHPADASQPWSEAVLSSVGAIEHLSCPSVGFCAAVGAGGGHDGSVLTSSDPTGGAAAWQGADTGAAALFDVSCPTSGYCVAVGEEAIVTSGQPAGGSAAWQTSAVPAMRSGAPDEIACASASLCAVAGGNGFVASSTSPAGGAGAWEAVSGVDGNNDMRAVSCPSESMCFAVDEALVAGLAAHRLTVAVTGAGEGVVRSGPRACPLGCTYSGPVCPRNCGANPFPNAFIGQRLEGIVCGVAEFADGQPFPLSYCSQLYPSQEVPALTAVPRRGSIFAGWSGDCAGRGACAPAMSSDRLLSAAFEPASSSPPRPRLALTAVAQLHRRWREPHRRSRAPLGTRFTFRLNRAAAVTLAFVQDVPGRRFGGRCRHTTRGPARAHRCIRRLPAGTIGLAARAGAGSVRFRGVVSGPGGHSVRLSPGSYTVRLTAASEGEAAPPRVLAFTIAA
jgi:hypothetical protein